jgi:cell wall-associated NlpC family hydrolase
MNIVDGSQRSLVVKEARKWIGTPYYHEGNVRGVGVDCGMLIVRVFVDTGLCSPFDPRPYPRDWFLHKSEEKYLGFILAHAKEVSRPEPGDLMIWRYGRCYSHGAIVTGLSPLTVVHAFEPARRVLEEAVESNPMLCEPRRKPKFFSYWAAVA